MTIKDIFETMNMVQHLNARPRRLRGLLIMAA